MPERSNEEVAEEEDSILHLIASPVEGGRLSHKKTFYPDTERVRAKRDNCSTYKDTGTFLVPVPVGAKNLKKKTYSSNLHEFRKVQKKGYMFMLHHYIIICLYFRGRKVVTLIEKSSMSHLTVDTTRHFLTGGAGGH